MVNIILPALLAAISKKLIAGVGVGVIAIVGAVIVFSKKKPAA